MMLTAVRLSFDLGRVRRWLTLRPMTTDADWLRAQLTALHLSQTALARALEIDERVVRRWAAGQERIPKLARLAVERLVDLQAQEAPPPKD
jgi:DNA-binding transcriptional regulator YiaG